MVDEWCMNGWRDGCMDGCVDELMVGWICNFLLHL